MDSVADETIITVDATAEQVKGCLRRWWERQPPQWIGAVQHELSEFNYFPDDGSWFGAICDDLRLRNGARYLIIDLRAEDRGLHIRLRSDGPIGQTYKQSALNAIAQCWEPRRETPSAAAIESSSSTSEVGSGTQPTLPPKRPNKAQRRRAKNRLRARELDALGETRKGIAKDLGVSERTVYDLLKDEDDTVQPCKT